MKDLGSYVLEHPAIPHLYVLMYCITCTSRLCVLERERNTAVFGKRANYGLQGGSLEEYEHQLTICRKAESMYDHVCFRAGSEHMVFNPLPFVSLMQRMNCESRYRK